MNETASSAPGGGAAAPAITFDGFRSPWPSTTGSCSSPKRSRIRATSASTAASGMPADATADSGADRMCASILRMKAHSATAFRRLAAAAAPAAAAAAAAGRRLGRCLLYTSPSPRDS